MEIKPVFAFAENLARKIEEGSDYELEAFAHIVENDLSSQVLLARLYGEDLEKLQALQRRELLMMVALNGGYSSDLNPDVQEDVDAIRQHLGPAVPILLIPDRPYTDPEFEIKEHNIVWGQKYSPELHAYIDQLRRTNPGVMNERRRASVPEQQALLQAYDSNYPEDTLLYTPDDNTKIVAEYLRCRNLGGEVVAREFDATLIKPKGFETHSEELFDQEVDRIRKMNDRDREEMVHEILTSQGFEKTDWGTYYQTSISRGRFCHPFAIEPNTMTSMVYSGFGAHTAGIDKWLKRKMASINAFREGREPGIDVYDSDKLDIPVVSGFVNEHVLTFETPILQLHTWDVPETTLRRVGQFVLGRRQMIPIDNAGRLVDRHYSAIPDTQRV